MWNDGLPSEVHYGRAGGIKELPASWRVLVEADLQHETYSFSMVIVWQDLSGALYAAADAGCSCPTPFDALTVEGCKRVHEVADLDPLIAFADTTGGYGGYRDGLIDASKADLIAAVHRALRDERRASLPWRGYGG